MGDWLSGVGVGFLETQDHSNFLLLLSSPTLASSGLPPSLSLTTTSLPLHL